MSKKGCARLIHARGLCFTPHRSLIAGPSWVIQFLALETSLTGVNGKGSRAQRRFPRKLDVILLDFRGSYFSYPFSRAAILWEQVMAKRNSACRTEHSCNVNLRKAAFHYARSRLPQARARKMTAGPLSHFPSRAMYQWLVLGQLPTYAVHGQGCSTVAKWRPSTAEALRVGTTLASRVPR